MEEQLCSCALCQDVLKDPVSTSCGHWFCRQCITSYWDQSASSGDSSCPQCGERSRRRPTGQNSSAQCKTQHLYQVKMSPATCHSVYLKTYSQCIQLRGYKTCTVPALLISVWSSFHPRGARTANGHDCVEL